MQIMKKTGPSLYKIIDIVFGYDFLFKKMNISNFLLIYTSLGVFDGQNSNLK
jgi:hypothetical protein